MADMAGGLFGKLSPEDETKFQGDMRFHPWYRDFQTKYGEPPNLEDPQYNYRLAWRLGAMPAPYAPDGGAYHWPSEAEVAPFRQPIPLKSQDHPTMWMQKFMDKFGQDPNEAAPNASPEMADWMLRNVPRGR